MFKILDEKDFAKWDSFVQCHPNGSIFHHSSWLKVLRETYNYKPILIVLENQDSGKIGGVLPFLSVDSYISGKRLVSLPFTAYCNVLMPSNRIIDAINFVMNIYNKVDYIELKLPADSNDILESYPKSEKFCTHVLDLDQDLNKIYKSFHSTSVRQRIKRAERDQLKFRISNNEKDLKKFYDLETKVRKRKGLPPSPFRFYNNIWKILRSENKVLLPVVEYENKIIAAAIVLKYNKKYYLEYSASNSNYLKYSPNQLLIWNIIAMAHKDGAVSFDFGRSSYANKSLIEFKERWAAQMIPLSYYYYPELRKQNDEGIARKFLESCNKKLPDFILKMEGKMVYRHLG